ncbi:hypothetical protein [Salinigranum salinum]|uniref:hypothetical protein n=1 Tax=Salinigranum salinum TaxID=1364937 RepID=UPI00126128B3|nr:hypothetical protein [Salinigranum salinum]
MRPTLTSEADDNDDDGILGFSQSRVYAIYVVWLVILLVSVVAGSYTLGFLVDTESIGTAEDPNSFQAVDEWAGFTVSNDDGGTANDDGGTANDDGGTANTQSVDVQSEGVLACDANAFCATRDTVDRSR